MFPSEEEYIKLKQKLENTNANETSIYKELIDYLWNQYHTYIMEDFRDNIEDTYKTLIKEVTIWKYEKDELQNEKQFMSIFGNEDELYFQLEYDNDTFEEQELKQKLFNQYSDLDFLNELFSNTKYKILKNFYTIPLRISEKDFLEEKFDARLTLRNIYKNRCLFYTEKFKGSSVIKTILRENLHNPNDLFRNEFEVY